MIQMETMVNIADNSGAKLGKVIHHWHKPQSSSIVRVSISAISAKKIKGKKQSIAGSATSAKTSTTPDQLESSKDKKGSLALGIVVRENRNTVRLNGLRTRFFDNAIVLLEAVSVHDTTSGTASIKGTRIFGPVTCALRRSSPTSTTASTAKLKILSLAGGIV